MTEINFICFFKCGYWKIINYLRLTLYFYWNKFVWHHLQKVLEQRIGEPGQDSPTSARSVTWTRWHFRALFSNQAWNRPKVHKGVLLEVEGHFGTERKTFLCLMLIAPLGSMTFWKDFFVKWSCFKYQLGNHQLHDLRSVSEPLWTSDSSC